MSTLDKLEKASKKAFLATIGTYAKGWELISGKTNEVLDEASKTFDQFAEDGEAIESELKTRVNQNNQLKEKFASLKAQFGLEATQEDNLEKLSNKVDELVKQVEVLVEAKAKQKEAKKTASKTVVKQEAQTAKPAQKTTAAKANAKKPVKTEASKSAQTNKAQPVKAKTASKTQTAQTKSVSNSANKAKPSKAQ